jgi:hypothetical protein
MEREKILGNKLDIKLPYLSQLDGGTGAAGIPLAEYFVLQSLYTS